MKPQNNTHTSKWAIILAGLLITSLVIAGIPIGSVQADSLYQGANPPAPINEDKGTAFLEKALQHEQKVNESLTNLFDKANKIIEQLDKAIQTGKLNGKDVTTLEKTLDQLQDQISSAAATRDTAADLLKKHSGFDDAGKVTEAKLASETIREVSKNHREVRHLLGNAFKDAFKAFHGYRQDNRPK